MTHGKPPERRQRVKIVRTERRWHIFYWSVSVAMIILALAAVFLFLQH